MNYWILQHKVKQAIHSPLQQLFSEWMGPEYTEAIHAYLCINCGGSPACEEQNKKHNLKCPKCGN